jgi:putative transposase
MSNYRRLKISGGTYFFTLVTEERRPWLCSEIARQTLRTGIERVRQRHPFTIEAFVLLPDHLHCIWTLPDGDSNFFIRWRLIKTFVTKNSGGELSAGTELNLSRQKHQESDIWQRRFWEHLIRDEQDFTNHCDYIHYNPVKHGLCKAPKDWPFSSFHRLVERGFYPADWGTETVPEVPGVGYE